ncbi:MAG TPA: tryptophan 7-halogenase [Rhodopila sp.]|nr:tryptophan 7-halogenase [Rhodopila sp.]
MIQADVCVIGGGPAGAAAALALARYSKHSVLLAEASRYEAMRVGETVSAGIVPLLSYLGADSVLTDAVTAPSYGTAGAWGSADLVRRDFIWTGRGQGLHLDRSRFDQALAACLSGLGSVPRIATQVREVDWRDDRWVVQLDGPDGREDVEARIIVDATGRQARIARRLKAERAVTDRLVGLVCHLDLPKGLAEQTTLVETVPEGWWYSATLPHGKAVAALMTDADLLRGLGIDTAADFLTALSATRHIAARLQGALPIGEPRAFPAESHVLRPPCGPGWIAAGDAACAFDPLASLGIGYALTSGIQAARITEQWLRGESGLAQAYATDIARHAAVYSAQARDMYQAERRWPDAPFWQRRQG